MSDKAWVHLQYRDSQRGRTVTIDFAPGDTMAKLQVQPDNGDVAADYVSLPMMAGVGITSLFGWADAAASKVQGGGA